MKFLVLLLLLPALAACKRTTPVAPAPPIDPPPQISFAGYDGDPKKTKAKDMSFQINWLDKKLPPSFLQLGDMVPNTHFRILSFQFKTRRNVQNGEEVDASELTLVSTQSNQTLILTLPKPRNSPPVL